MKNILVGLLLLGGMLAAQAYANKPEKAPRTVLDQGLHLQVQPVFGKKRIRLNEPLNSSTGDSLSLHTLRCYLSNFTFLKNGAPVFEEKNSYHLLDLEDENTLNLEFQVPESVAFDQLKFELGIDSLTHISGAMGGDLDPTKGMFWTWQSGYINAKIEGFSEKCPARNHEFQFHLGGYLSPFQSCQPVLLSLPKGKNLALQLNLMPFFDHLDWAKKYTIMSPSTESVVLSKVLAQSFSVYAE